VTDGAVAREAADTKINGPTVCRSGSVRACGLLRYRAERAAEQGERGDYWVQVGVLARLRHGVDEVRLTALHDAQAASNRRCEISRIGYGTR
jgi:hypothetical protein